MRHDAQVPPDLKAGLGLQAITLVTWHSHYALKFFEKTLSCDCGAMHHRGYFKVHVFSPKQP
jgi:hypothetical protein